VDFVMVQRRILNLGLVSVAAHVARLALIHCAYRALRKLRAPGTAATGEQAITMEIQ
jgi:hypothetical protein